MAEGVSVLINADASQFDTGLKRAGKSMDNFKQQAAAAAKSQKEMAAEAQKAGYKLMGVAQAVDDVQYGFKGIANNIPTLLMGFGASAGLSAVLSIVAIVGYQVINMFSKFGASAKQAGQDSLQSAQAMENAQARVAQATRNRAQAERELVAAMELSKFAADNKVKGFEAELSAIQTTTEAIRNKTKAEAELQSAQKDLALAKVDGSGDPELKKIESKAAIMAKFSDQERKRKLEDLDIAKQAAEKEMEIQKRIFDEANKRDQKSGQVTQERKAAEEEVRRLEKEKESEKLKAINTLRNAEAKFSNKVDGKFDVGKSSAAEVLKEAQRVITEGLGNAAPDWMDKANALGVALGASPQASLGSPSQYNGADDLSKITTDQQRALMLQSLIDDAKSKAKGLGDVSGMDANARAESQKAFQRQKELAEKIKQIDLEKAAAGKIGAIQKQTEQEKVKAELEAQKKKESEAVAKEVGKMKDTVVSDAITKIGGGGFVGTSRGTTEDRIARASEKIEKQASIQTELLKEIRDKNPTWQ